MTRPSTATTGPGSGRHGPIPFRALVLLTLAASACSPAGDDAPGHTVTDSAGITIVTSTAPAWAPGEEWAIGEVVTSIGAVDGPPESQLFQVRGATRMADGRVVVANAGSQEVRLYAPHGSWIRSMGGRGEGPGEFGSLASVQLLPPDTILALDTRGSRVTLYTADGELLGTRRLPSPSIPALPPEHRFPDGRWLDRGWHSDPPRSSEGFQRTHLALGAWTEGDDAIDTLVAGPAGETWLQPVDVGGGRRIYSTPVPFGGRSLTAIGPGRIALSSGLDYDIRVGEVDGRRFRIRRPVQRRAVTDDDVARFIDDAVARWPEDTRPDARARYRSARPGDRMPTHTALLYDAAGNLWVENFRAPGEEVPRRWSVHDPDGRWLGDVDLPEGLGVFEIGDDYVLSLQRDALDVEYVRTYRLEKQPQ